MRCSNLKLIRSKLMEIISQQTYGNRLRRPKLVCPPRNRSCPLAIDSASVRQEEEPFPVELRVNPIFQIQQLRQPAPLPPLDCINPLRNFLLPFPRQINAVRRHSQLSLDWLQRIQHPLFSLPLPRQHRVRLARRTMPIWSPSTINAPNWRSN